MTTGELEKVFARIEAAIDAHPKLKRAEGWSGGDATLHLSRLGVTVRIKVKLKGSRRKPVEITGSGDSIELAADSFVNGLDVWAEVLSTS